MDITVRSIETGDLPDFVRANELAFGHHATDEDVEVERAVSEPARSLAALDGDRIVGTCGAYSLTLTVPGGTVPLAGVTQVGVVPTHRRRGILTALMRRQLDDLRDRGECLAGLWTAEGGIYGRFGYGPAAQLAQFDIERHRAAFAGPPLSPDGTITMVGREAAMAAMPEIYEAVRPHRPGMLVRTGPWWEHVFADTEHFRDGAGPYFFALRRAPDGTLDGYAVYRVKGGWTDRGPDHEVRVRELLATSPGAYDALWRYCVETDLAARIRAWNRPADEPLMLMLADPQRLGLRVKDSLWLRLVDVPRALASRAYSVHDELVFGVHDAFCPWNEGSYRLESTAQGVRCEPVEGGADLVLDAADLGAAYLSGTRFSTLAQAGRVREETPGALDRAEGLFAARVTPWCSNIF